MADAPGASARYVALVVEDNPIEAQVLCRILRSCGFAPTHAADGMAAIEMYPRVQPDVVLLDYAMPVMNGRETALRLRALDPTRWVPIWFVTGNEDTAEVAEAIAAGADAYLPKPVNAAILRAHLSNAARYTDIQRQMRDQNGALKAYFEASEAENRAARSIMQKLLPIQTEHGAVLRTWNSPAFKFSGDIVMAERSPDGSLKVLLADGVGHGLTAALNVLPIGRAFQSMAQKGFGLPALVTELNHTIRRDLPSHRFVAVTLVSIDSIEGRIEVWNGGNPPVLMIDSDGAAVARWDSTHLPLGVVASEDLDSRPDYVPFRDDVQLFLCSDGLMEAEAADGSAFAEAGVLRAFRDWPAKDRFESVKIAVADHLAGESAKDDITIAIVDCGAELERRTRRSAARTVPQQALVVRPHAASGDWELRLRIGAERLTRVDIIPILQEFMSRLDPAGAIDESTFRVLAELYDNALEHGLLELDSRLKEEANGHVAYARERERRLAQLADGVIHIDVARIETDAGPKMRIRVKDSGKGFDERAWRLDAGALFRRADRGISLVESLCESVEYRNGGSEIEVTRALPAAMPAPEAVH
ncbi:MAG: SpoIIE family protein phosphatase [Burkholderiales bacterium]|nr:SpoIIE family protein phosphatase [Burkholderiales bacterium]